MHQSLERARMTGEGGGVRASVWNYVLDVIASIRLMPSPGFYRISRGPGGTRIIPEGRWLLNRGGSDAVKTNMPDRQWDGDLTFPVRDSYLITKGIQFRARVTRVEAVSTAGSASITTGSVTHNIDGAYSWHAEIPDPDEEEPNPDAVIEAGTEIVASTSFPLETIDEARLQFTIWYRRIDDNGADYYDVDELEEEEEE